MYHKDNAADTVWSMFYESSDKNNIVKQTNPNIDLYSNKHFVFKCVFYNQWSSIFIIAKNLKILHSECTFTRCKGTIGGTIYMKGDSSFVQHRYCASSCISTGEGIFSYVNLNNYSSINFNYNIEGSLSQNNGYQSINYIDDGQGTISSMNYSKNFAESYYSFSSNDVNDGLVNYSNIEGNNIIQVYVTRVFLFNYADPEVTITNSNYDRLTTNKAITQSDNFETSKSNTLTFFVNFDCHTQTTINQNQIKCYCSSGESISYVTFINFN